MKRARAKVDLGVVIGVLLGLAVITAVLSVVFWDTTGDSGSGLSDEYTYDLTSLPPIDLGLIKYGQVAEYKLGAPAMGVAVGPGDSIYVAVDNAIRVLDAAGNVLRTITTGPYIRCLAVDADHTVYAGFEEHVEVFGPDGGRAAAWAALGQRAVITSIAVGKEDVFVADAGNRVVVRYDKSGKLVSEIGRKDARRDIAGFVIPSPHFDVAIAPDGLLRVVDPGRHLVEAFDFAGDRRFSWGRAGTAVEAFCGCCNPVAIAILPNGNIVTAEKGIVRVKEYDGDGHLTAVVAGPEQLVDKERLADGAAAAFDVAVDSRGRVYVLDTIRRSVRVFEKKQTQ